MENQPIELATPIKINQTRLKRNLFTLAAMGKNKQSGIDRSFGSPADLQARKWLLELWRKAFGAETEIDPAANLWAGIEGREALPPIVLGSHHDSVPNGGMYDGALGVLLATEVVQTLKEQGTSPRHPLKVVSFSAEEPNPYHVSTLGSRAITGKLTKEVLQQHTHSETHEKLIDTIKNMGGDAAKLRSGLLKQGDIRAFLECHIEQGRNLFDSGIAVGIVTKITGIYREKIKIYGEANHAGTTHMKYRHDALLAGSELNTAFEKIILGIGRDDVVGTIGYINVRPNSANIIPGEVEFIAEIRTPDQHILKNMIAALTEQIFRIEKNREVRIEREVILNQDAVQMDSHIQQVLKKVLHSANEPYLEIPSMAGHDAVHMAAIANTGMVFVPSINGKSHCPDEKTNMEDIEKAGNVLLQTVLILDKECD
ncbi:allantoate amidohydrolase [Heyndrickxia acidiproducens]|uniref:allantoate amidohydrolase n=1 Tax=Heyndrickxia acidiproducens TaxID=1121084 RepID=UPI00037E4E53|nr:allantoate amidohydrolase [Heyndrickxia acidiproducens]